MTKARHGISPKSFQLLIDCLHQEAVVEKAVIFGSRANGTSRKGSDIDIAIFGDAIKEDTALHLSAQLNEVLPIPYFIDVVAVKFLQNLALKKHILLKGVLIFDREIAKVE